MDQDSSIVVEPSEMEQVDRLLTRQRQWISVAFVTAGIALAFSIVALALNLWLAFR